MIIPFSDDLILQWEKEFGKDETYSCEWFSYCSGCDRTGWMDCMNYDQDDGNHYCDSCFEKRKERNERNENIIF